MCTFFLVVAFRDARFLSGLYGRFSYIMFARFAAILRDFVRLRSSIGPPRGCRLSYIPRYDGTCSGIYRAGTSHPCTCTDFQNLPMAVLDIRNGCDGFIMTYRYHIHNLSSFQCYSNAHTRAKYYLTNYYFYTMLHHVTSTLRGPSLEGGPALCGSSPGSPVGCHAAPWRSWLVHAHHTISKNYWDAF